MTEKNLTTITKKQANRLLLKDVKGKLVAGVMGGAGIGAGLVLTLAPSARNFDDVTSLGVSLISGGFAIYKSRTACNIIMEYISDAEKYMREYHDCKLE